jgi:hypothetical protein
MSEKGSNVSLCGESGGPAWLKRAAGALLFHHQSDAAAARI